jgi:hypothetical protein
LTKHQHTKRVKIKELDEEEDLVLSRPFVRAALIVLLQHRIVLAMIDDKRGLTMYEHNHLPVLKMLRCARMSEYISKAVGSMAECRFPNEASFLDRAMLRDNPKLFAT